MAKYKSKVLGGLFEYNTDDKSLTIIDPPNEDVTIPESVMRGIAKEYKGTNRMHKSAGLLFWTDCKNGKQNNYELIKD